jgi:hypothetical protein
MPLCSKTPHALAGLRFGLRSARSPELEVRRTFLRNLSNICRMEDGSACVREAAVRSPRLWKCSRLICHLRRACAGRIERATICFASKSLALSGKRVRTSARVEEQLP